VIPTYTRTVVHNAIIIFNRLAVTPQTPAALDSGLQKGDFYGCSTEQQTRLGVTFAEVQRLLREAAEFAHLLFNF
jgi:hypothetical protein